MKERWRSVVGYEGLYEVSDQGRVRSVCRVVRCRNRWGHISTRTYKGKVLATSRNRRNGYAIVPLRRHGVQYARTVHALVLTAFQGPRPANKEAAHENGKLTDNRLSNLSWKTHLDNVADRVRHGTLRRRR